MAVVIVSRDDEGYKIDPQRLEVDRRESIVFVGGLVGDYKITFDREVLTGLMPGRPHQSKRSILLGRAVNRSEQSNYELVISQVTVNGRIIVRPPGLRPIFKILLALLVGIAAGIAGTLFWPWL